MSDENRLDHPFVAQPQSQVQSELAQARQQIEELAIALSAAERERDTENQLYITARKCAAKLEQQLAEASGHCTHCICKCPECKSNKP